MTVHDLQHLDHPELFSRAERLFRARTHEGSARHADAVIVPSQFVRRRAIELLGLPPERVHAIPWGLDHERFHPGRRAAGAVPALSGPSVAAQEPRPALPGVRAAPRGAARATARPDGRRPRGPLGAGGRGGARTRLRRRAGVALSPHRLPRLPEPLRGLRAAAARSDGIGRPRRSVEHPRRGGGVWRGGRAVRSRPSPRTSPRSCRACSTPRSVSPPQVPSARAASPGPRRRAGTRRSTGLSERRSSAPSARGRPPPTLPSAPPRRVRRGASAPSPP